MPIEKCSYAYSTFAIDGFTLNLTDGNYYKPVVMVFSLTSTVCAKFGSIP